MLQVGPKSELRNISLVLNRTKAEHNNSKYNAIDIHKLWLKHVCVSQKENQSNVEDEWKI